MNRLLKFLSISVLILVVCISCKEEPCTHNLVRVETVKATCTAGGKYRNECTICSYKTIEFSTPALGHDFSLTENNLVHKHICANCGMERIPAEGQCTMCTTYYKNVSTLEELNTALNAEKSYIVVSADIEIGDSSLQIKHDTEIDLKGHTLNYSGTGSYLIKAMGGDISIMNGTLTGRRGISISNDSKCTSLNLEKLTIIAGIHALTTDIPLEITARNCNFSTTEERDDYYTVYLRNNSITAEKGTSLLLENTNITNVGSNVIRSLGTIDKARTNITIKGECLFTVKSFASGSNHKNAAVYTRHTNLYVDPEAYIVMPESSTNYYYYFDSESSTVASSGEYDLPYFYYRTMIYVKEVNGEKATCITKTIPWKEEVFGGLTAQEYAVRNNKLLVIFMAGDGSKFNYENPDKDKWGDATLLVFPNGETMLIDGGIPRFSNHLISSMWKLGVTKLDYLMLSHNHLDHWGGLLASVWSPGAWATFTPDVFYHNNIFGNNTARFTEMKKMASTYNTQMVVLDDSKSKSFGNVQMNVIWPVAGTTDYLTPSSLASETNSASIVAKFVYGNFSVLFTGDLYAEAEADILNVKKNQLRATILKACHHGRTTSSSPAFTAAVSADYAVALGHTIISDDGYGNINKIVNVSDSFKKAGTTLYSDYLNGFILVETDGKTYNIYCSGK